MVLPLPRVATILLWRPKFSQGFGRISDPPRSFAVVLSQARTSLTCPPRDSQPLQISRAASFLLRGRMCRVRTRGIDRANQGRKFQLAWPVVVPDDLPVGSSPVEVQPCAKTRLRGKNTRQRRPTDHAVCHGGRNRRSHDRLFRKNEHGHRPYFGPYRKFQEDPHWRDYLLFNEYYHGDAGQGLGAGHQPCWTGIVANLIDEWRR